MIIVAMWRRCACDGDDSDGDRHETLRAYASMDLMAP